jgi:hypothetical protein
MSVGLHTDKMADAVEAVSAIMVYLMEGLGVKVEMVEVTLM